MAAGRKQIQRLILIVGELKENRYPNCISIAAKLSRSTCLESCSVKTIQRDMQVLKNEFNAPLNYDYERKGFYLAHHGWDFRCPVFEEAELLASVLGAHLAEDIFPDPLRERIRMAKDVILTENNPDFLDSAYIHSLIIASGLKVSIHPEVFKIIFEAWQKHLTVRILYRDASGSESGRSIEPHVLAFHDSAWFIRARCLMRNARRTFAIHRILSVKIDGKTYEPDPDIIEGVKSGILFDYKPVKGILIECEKSILSAIQERPLHSQQKITGASSGKFILKIPSASEFELINWVMQQRGKASLLKPDFLRKLIVSSAEELIKAHRRETPGHLLSGCREYNKFNKTKYRRSGKDAD